MHFGWHSVLIGKGHCMPAFLRLLCISWVGSEGTGAIVNPKQLCSFYLSGNDDWQLKQMYRSDCLFVSQTTSADVFRSGFKGILQ